MHHYCKRRSNYETVKAILDQAKNNGDYYCKKILEEKLGMEHHSPLHEAVFFQTSNIVQLLLDYGADVNAKTSMSYTPLHLATFNNDLNCLKLLVQHQCIDFNAKDCSRKTAYERAKLDGNEEVAKYIKSEGMHIYVVVQFFPWFRFFFKPSNSFQTSLFFQTCLTLVSRYKKKA